MCEMFRSPDDSIEGKRAMVSESGNVSRSCILKLIRLGTISISWPDSKRSLLFRNDMKLETIDATNKFKREM
jgi:glutamate dehydrogenase/leucine dehydrogenase